jgi:hypothetical protein
MSFEETIEIEFLHPLGYFDMFPNKVSLHDACLVPCCTVRPDISRKDLATLASCVQCCLGESNALSRP